VPVLSSFFGIIVRMWHDVLRRSTAFKELTMMIKILRAVHLGGRRLELTFSDGLRGEWDGAALLARSGPLLELLRDQAFFERFFIDAGSLCWPHGLELSPDRLHDQVKAAEHA
jgi:hypothetical protein